MDRNCKNCLFRERSYDEYPCEKCRNANNWTPSDNLLEFTIEEFEKLKAKVCEPNEMEYFENSNVWQKWFCDLVDNQIKELKEENKDCVDCGNNCDNGCCKKGCIGYCEGRYWKPKGENNGENNDS